MSKDTSFAPLWTTVKPAVSPRPSISRRSLLRSVNVTESGNWRMEAGGMVLAQVKAG